MNFEFAMSYSLDELSSMRKALERFLSNSGLEVHIQESIILGVDEVCSNAIKHGDINKFADHLHIRIQQDPTGLHIHIWDIGGTPPSIPSKEEIEARIDNNEATGYGLFILNQNMDKIEFSPQNNFYICKMFKAYS